MRISFLLAKTYLLSFKQKAFISFINILSFLGLIVGVAALICVTSIFNGFRELVRDMLLTIDPHVRITLLNSQADSTIHRLKEYHEIKTIEKSASSKIIVAYHDKTQAGVLLTKKNTIKKDQNNNKVAIGIGLADKLDVKKGDTIRLSTPDMIDVAISGLMMPQHLKLIIDSIFQISSGVQYDNSYLICDYDYYVQNKLSGKQFIDLRLHDPDQVDNSIMAMRSDKYLQSLRIESWKDLHNELYKTMEFERNMSFIILGLITFVSAFNILIAMWMTVKSKSKDIATLLSMGTERSEIQVTFVLQGLIIGISGTVLGSIIGVILCLGQNKYGWIQLPNSIVQAMPVSLQWEVVVSSIVLGVGVSAIAGIYPAKLAMNTNISQELRQD